MISLILIAIAAFCNGVMDVLYSHYYSSVFNQKTFNVGFWDPQISWRNKWKDGDPKKGDRFFLSSSGLVWLTDAWHLFKAIMLACLFGAVVFYVPMVSTVIDWVVCLSVWGAVFGVTYRALKRTEKQ